jgi:hypothetical protein
MSETLLPNISKPYSPLNGIKYPETTNSLTPLEQKIKRQTYAIQVLTSQLKTLGVDPDITSHKSQGIQGKLMQLQNLKSELVLLEQHTNNQEVEGDKVEIESLKDLIERLPGEYVTK